MNDNISKEKIRIFLVDDHALVIDSLSDILREEQEFEIVGSARNGLELLEKLPTCPTDIILLDIRMPKMNGIKTIEKIKVINQDLKILIISTIGEGKIMSLAFENEVNGYISKTIGKKDIIDAVKRVINGETVIMVETEEEDPIDIGRQSTNSAFSNRETEILKFIVEGRKTKEIAEKLSLSPHTIERHRKDIMNKLEVDNVAGMVREAIKNKIVEI